MPLCKICPACKHINDVTENICKDCGIDIAGVTPIDNSVTKSVSHENSYKICPKCNEQFSLSEIICPNCFESLKMLSDASIEKDSANTEEDSDVDVEDRNKVILEKPQGKKIYILCKFVGSGKEIVINNGDIVGRNGKGREILSEYKTISRKHAMFISENGRWYLMDLKSANFTYLNNKKVSPNERVLLNNMDRINLAGDIEFIIEIKSEYKECS